MRCYDQSHLPQDQTAMIMALSVYEAKINNFRIAAAEESMKSKYPFSISCNVFQYTGAIPRFGSCAFTLGTI